MIRVVALLFAAAAAPVAAVAPVALELDDECRGSGGGRANGDEHCAWSSLQLRGERRAASDEVAERVQGQSSGSFEVLCAKAAEACGALHGKRSFKTEGGAAGLVSLAALKDLLAAAPSSFEAFADAVKLKDMMTGDDLISCTSLCQSAASYLSESGVTMPPGPDIGCYLTDEGKDVCTEDLSPTRLVERYGSPDIKAERQKRMTRTDQQEVNAADQDSGIKLKSRIKLKSHRSAKAVEGELPALSIHPLQHEFEQKVAYHRHEMALRLLYLFHIYPRAFNTYQKNLVDTPHDWQHKLAVFNLVARVYLMSTIRYLRLHDTAQFLDTWFGPGSSSHKPTRMEVLRILNSVLTVMDTAEFVYNSTTCSPGVFAFVDPTGYKAVPDGSSIIRENNKGRPVVYICPFTINAEENGIIFEAVQAVIHESSHHGIAYTQDVKLCPRIRYLWLASEGLADLSGHGCGKDVPRFSQEGQSCDVPGEEIMAISRTRLPSHALGNVASARCTANMRSVPNASACEIAAKSLGTRWMGTEDTDWPKGCYEATAGEARGVYFNIASVGFPSMSARPICETLPPYAETRSDAGECPPSYEPLLDASACKAAAAALQLPFRESAAAARGCSTATAGPGKGVYFTSADADAQAHPESSHVRQICTTALPYVEGKPKTNQCPENAQELFLSASCQAAASNLGLDWNSTVVDADKPVGCYKESSGEVNFNAHANGSSSEDAVPICRKSFSFSVMDPRLKYYLKTLRFSQDGEYTLFEVQDMELALLEEDGCDMGYGQDTCKDLAKEDPAKALMNADSFGYYVLDAGSAGFAKLADLS